MRLLHPVNITLLFYHNTFRTCSDFSCLGSCQSADILKNFDDCLTPIQTNDTSSQDGEVEPACRLGYINLHNNSVCDSGEETEIGNYNKAPRLVRTPK